MRRFIFGVAILGVGTLFSLPFRRSIDGDASINPQPNPANHAMDLQSLDLLVQEVTADVQVPVLYEAKTNDVPRQAHSPMMSETMRYEDYAVPVEHDPYFEERFNATVAVNGKKELSKRVKSIQQRFAAKASSKTEKQPAGQSLSATLASAAPTAPEGPQPADQLNPPRMVRTPVPTQTDTDLNEQRGGEKSVLVQLPSPSDPDDDIERHWIKQPD